PGASRGRRRSGAAEPGTLVPRAPVRAGFAAPRCAWRGASNPARWGTLHSVLPLHGEKPGADFGFLLLGTVQGRRALIKYSNSSFLLVRLRSVSTLTSRKPSCSNCRA